uniref:PFU domain-containing protein n=1 Tax=Tetraselmis chuii TaxID=63592 RepID=A0A7S1T7Z2_9CHLO
MAVGSKIHNGQEWDYVFDVDVADGMPPLKLALNRGDNPYKVADDFLMQYELPATYKDQMVQFILQNTGGNVTMPVSNLDPYTGSGAYVPSAGSGFPSSGSTQGTVTGGGVDPYTGGMSQPVALQHCPLKTHLSWLSKLSNPSAIATRVRDLSESFASAMSEDAVDPLLPDEAAPGGALDKLLENAAKCSFDKGGSQDPFTEADMQLLRKMLAWPASAIYPALDIVRLVVLSPEGAAKLAVDAGELLPAEGPPTPLFSLHTHAHPSLELVYSPLRQFVIIIILLF